MTARKAAFPCFPLSPFFPTPISLPHPCPPPHSHSRLASLPTPRPQCRPLQSFSHFHVHQDHLGNWFQCCFLRPIPINQPCQGWCGPPASALLTSHPDTPLRSIHSTPSNAHGQRLWSVLPVGPCQSLRLSSARLPTCPRTASPAPVLKWLGFLLYLAASLRNVKFMDLGPLAREPQSLKPCAMASSKP